MLLHTLCLSAILLAGTDGQSQDRGDYRYEPAHSAWYKVHPRKASWLTAVLSCAAEGAELAVPRSPAEATTLVRLAGTASRPMESNWGSAIWVDVSDLVVQGNYTTRMGTPVVNLYNRWHAGEPSHPSERCAFLYPDLDLWDHKCDAVHYFICKMSQVLTRHPQVSTSNSEKIDSMGVKPTSHKGYVYMSKGSGWYKVHHGKMTWTAALITCSGEDAELATPATPEEAQTLLELVGAAWRPIEGNWGSAIWVGLSDHVQHGNYQTAEGIPNSKLFNRWHPGEPSRVSEHCAFLYPGLELWDHDCNALHYFVCKKRDSDCDHLNNLQKGPVKIEGYTYIQEHLASYKTYFIKKDWTTAMLTCLAEGSELAVPSSTAEAQALVRLAGTGSRPLEGAYGSGIWVDVTDFVYPRYFSTKNGTSVIQVYNRWHPGEPSHPSERCAFLYPDLDLWDHNCDVGHYFICKFNHRADTVCDPTKKATARPGVEFRDDYAFVVEQAAFYKVHHKKSAWGEALLKCWHEGAELLAPSSLEEADIAMSLAGPDARPIEGSWGSAIWVALNDFISPNNYLTTDGMSAATGFNRWHQGEPNIASEHCAFLYPGLDLWDHGCQVPHYFVCKKPAAVGSYNIKESIEDIQKINELETKAAEEKISCSKNIANLSESLEQAEGKSKQCDSNSAKKDLEIQDLKRTVKNFTKIFDYQEKTSKEFFIKSNDELKNCSENLKLLNQRQTELESINGKQADTIGTMEEEQEDLKIYYSELTQIFKTQFDQMTNDLSAKLSEINLKPYPNENSNESSPILNSKRDTKQQFQNLMSNIKSFAKNMQLLFDNLANKDGSNLNFNQMKPNTDVGDSNEGVVTDGEVVEWQEAMRACEQLGSRLALPSSPQDKQRLGLQLSRRNWTTVWVGSTRTVIDRRFADSAEEGGSWVEEQREYCMQLTKEGQSRLADCSERHRYICESNTETKAASEHCGGDHSTGYQYASFNQKCYKIHEEPESWETAANKCREEGGHLGILNSDEEAFIYTSLFSQKSADILNRTPHNNFIHVGFQFTFTAGMKTLEGQIPSEAGYDKWDSPISLLKPEGMCGVLWRSGSLGLENCSYKAFFICEKPSL